MLRHTHIISSILALLLLTSCQLDHRTTCVSDAECRHGRICLDGICQSAQPSAGPTVQDVSTADEPTSPDANLQEFCRGQAKAMLGNQVMAPVSVTSAPYPMRSCCEDIYVRFHTQSAFEWDTTVWIGWSYGVVGRETIELDSIPENVDVAVCRTDPPACELADLQGTVELTVNETDHSANVSICLQVDQPEGELDGMRLFADDVFVAPWNWWHRFGLWLLADSTITPDEAREVPLDNLELDDLALIDLSALAYYELDTYTFVVNSYASDVFGRLPLVGVEGLPFVITADDERILLGSFWTQVSSLCPEGVVIYVESEQDNRLQMEWGCSDTPPTDPRRDERLLQVLREAERLVE